MRLVFLVVAIVLFILGFLTARVLTLGNRFETYEINAGEFPDFAYWEVNDALSAGIGIPPDNKNKTALSSSDVIVVVSPGFEGFRVHIAAPNNSKIWDEKVSDSLLDWIKEELVEKRARWRQQLEEKHEQKPKDPDAQGQAW